MQASPATRNGLERSKTRHLRQHHVAMVNASRICADHDGGYARGCSSEDRAPAFNPEVAEFESRQPTNPVPAVNLTERVAVPPMEDGEQYWLRMWENGNRIARPDSRRRSASRAVQQVRHHSCPDGGAGSIPDRPTRKNNHASKDVVQCPKPCQTRPANRLRPPDAD